MFIEFLLLLFYVFMFNRGLLPRCSTPYVINKMRLSQHSNGVSSILFRSLFANLLFDMQLNP